MHGTWVVVVGVIVLLVLLLTVVGRVSGPSARAPARLREIFAAIRDARFPSSPNQQPRETYTGEAALVRAWVREADRRAAQGGTSRRSAPDKDS